jgi:hypothetical protein
MIFQHGIYAGLGGVSASPGFLADLEARWNAYGATTDGNNNIISLNSNVNGNNYTLNAPATTSRRPTIAQVNSKPVMRFNPANSQCLIGGDILDIGVTDWSLQLLTKITGTSFAGIVSKSVYAAANFRYSIYIDTMVNVIVPYGGGSYSVFPNNEYATILLTYNRAEKTINIYISGIQQLSSTMPDTTIGEDLNNPFRYLLGAYNNSDDTGEMGFFAGDIVEVLHYRRGFTEIEAGQNHAWQMGEWGFN